MLKGKRGILLILSLSWAFGFSFPTTGLAAKAPAKEEATIPADYYRQLGIPAITQAWSPADYIQAATVFSSVVQRNPKYLPHYADKVAAPYMQHMADGRNLYDILRFANSHEQRFELITQYLDGIQRLLAVYQQALTQSAPYYEEWIDLIALSSYLAALSTPEWQYYLPNPQAQLDANSSAKLEAIDIIQTALNPVITGIQTTPKLSARLAWRLIEKLNYSLPIYAASLPLNAQQQLYEALVMAAQRSKDTQIRQQLYQLSLQFNKTQG